MPFPDPDVTAYVEVHDAQNVNDESGSIPLSLTFTRQTT
jgi:hypothetical protein